MATQQSDHEPRLNAVRKALGEPAFCELSDKAWRIRTNLIIVSVVSAGVVLWDLHISPDSTVFGLKFSGLTDAVLRRGLFWVLLYLVVHFLWCSFDNLLEWRLRITGTRLAFITTGRIASDYGDYPNDPRQTSLYQWWMSEAETIARYGVAAKRIEEKLPNWDGQVQAALAAGANPVNVGNVTHAIGELRDNLVQIKRAVDDASKVISSHRIPVSLERFDDWFQLFLRSQNLRWLLLEWAMPLLFGGWALLLLRTV